MNALWLYTPLAITALCLATMRPRRAHASRVRMQAALDANRELPRWDVPEAADYALLRGWAAVMNGAPYDRETPLSSRLGGAATTQGVVPRSEGFPTAYAFVDVVAAPPSRSAEGHLLPERGAPAVLKGAQP